MPEYVIELFNRDNGKVTCYYFFADSLEAAELIEKKSMDEEAKTMKYASDYHVKGNGRMFFTGDEVSIKTQDGGGRVGTISHITSKGVYLDVGNKKDTHFNFDKIDEIRFIN